MRANELIVQLQQLVDEYGDKEIAMDDGIRLRVVNEVDLGAEEDDLIIIWPRGGQA